MIRKDGVLERHHVQLANLTGLRLCQVLVETCPYGQSQRGNQGIFMMES